VALRYLATAPAESHGAKKDQVSIMLMDMVGVIDKHLKKGGRPKLRQRP